MRRLLRRALYLLRRRRLEAELIEEMDTHRAMAERDLAANGIDPTAAQFAARRTLGSALLAQDRSRDVWIPHALQGLGQDIRIAIRMLWKTRIVSIVALFSLALGIGVNTAIFSLVNAVVLRALPARDPGGLALLVEPGQFRGVPLFIGYAVWEQIRTRTDLFERAAVWSPITTNIASGGQTELVETVIASGSFFDVLGVPVIAGRAFSGQGRCERVGPRRCGTCHCDQLRTLAAAIRRRARYDRPVDRARPRSVHDHRRHAPAFLRS